MGSIKEQVTHILDPTSASHIPLFLPRIVFGDDGSGEDGGGERKPFQAASDIDRVMDYPNMPDPPPACLVMHCEAPGSGIDPSADAAAAAGGGGDDYDLGGVVFPKRSAKLAGGYVFLSKPRDRDADDGGDDDDEGGGKVACVPLRGCEVDFPPGGRRVFREHAHTDARRGYEMAIHVRPPPGAGAEGRMTCYIVLDSLGQREAWASAIKLRHDVGNKLTILRPGGIAAARLMSAEDSYYDKKPSLSPGMAGSSGVAGGRHLAGGKSQRHWGLRRGVSTKNVWSGAEGGGPAGAGSGDSDLDAAIEQFGVHVFEEEKWVHEFLQKHAVSELPDECDRLEKWMDVIKNGLRGAVLEQYEYFVEASREMSTMGREVAWIRTLVERQQETLMSMRNIDFGAGFEDADRGAGDEEHGYLSEDDALNGLGNDDLSDASSVVSSSSDEDNSSPSRTLMRTNHRSRRRETRKKSGGTPLPSMAEDRPTPPSDSQSPQIEIPPWISDVTEEVSAFIKESRYSDATELILKAKAEVSDILSAHEQPTPPVVTTPTSSLGSRNTAHTASMNGSNTGDTQKKLHKKQQTLLQRTNVQLDALMDRMSKRLAENLRRKNEALKASAKRERADPLSNLAPLVSPVCLNDDAVALHLLVKLGRYQEAATAYAARRSLLLSEW